MKTSATSTIERAVKTNDLKIKKLQITDYELFGFFPKLFGEGMELRGGLLVDAFANRIARGREIRGWNFYMVSNATLYMAPNWKKEVHATWSGNGFSGMLSPDAVGIFATLMAVHLLASEHQDERLASHYYKLLDFAAVHPQAEMLLRAID